MIYGERIRLRGVEKEDLPKFVEWLNDPEVVDGLGMYLPLSSGDENRWYEEIAVARTCGKTAGHRGPRRGRLAHGRQQQLHGHRLEEPPGGSGIVHRR